MNNPVKLSLNSICGSNDTGFKSPVARAAYNYCIASLYPRVIPLSCKLIRIECELFRLYSRHKTASFKSEWLIVNELLNRYSIEDYAPVPIEILKDLYLNYPKYECINNIIMIIEQHIEDVY